MACRLFGAKPLSKPLLGYYQLDPKERTSLKLYSKYKTFHSRKCIWKCRLSEWRTFCPGKMSFNVSIRLIMDEVVHASFTSRHDKQRRHLLNFNSTAWHSSRLRAFGIGEVVNLREMINRAIIQPITSEKGRAVSSISLAILAHYYRDHYHPFYSEGYLFLLILFFIWYRYFSFHVTIIKLIIWKMEMKWSNTLIICYFNLNTTYNIVTCMLLIIWYFSLNTTQVCS